MNWDCPYQAGSTGEYGTTVLILECLLPDFQMPVFYLFIVLVIVRLIILFYILNKPKGNLDTTYFYTISVTAAFKK